MTALSVALGLCWTPLDITVPSPSLSSIGDQKLLPNFLSISSRLYLLGSKTGGEKVSLQFNIFEPLFSRQNSQI